MHTHTASSLSSEIFSIDLTQNFTSTTPSHRFSGFSFAMRIRERKPTADCSVSSSPSPSPSQSSSFSSNSSSLTASHSLASSQDSSNSCPFSLSSTASPRCRGLDLLVKAIHQVNAGSAVGVPYIQRRVTIRRRRRSHGLEFGAFVLDELRERKRGRITKRVNNSQKTKRGENLVGYSSGIQDSVLQPWRRRSDHADEMGLC